MSQTTYTKFVFFGPIRKLKWPPLLPIGWDIFRLLLCIRWMDLNQPFQETRSQCSLPSFVFLTDLKTKMAVLAYDLLRLFRLLCNRWTKFNETWQEARSQHSLLPSLCFWGHSESKDGTSSTKFVIFRLIIIRTRQIIRYRASASLWRPLYTASNEGGGLQNKQEHHIILTKYEAVHLKAVSENYSACVSFIMLVLRCTNVTFCFLQLCRAFATNLQLTLWRRVSFGICVSNLRLHCW